MYLPQAVRGLQGVQSVTSHLRESISEREVTQLDGPLLRTIHQVSEGLGRAGMLQGKPDSLMSGGEMRKPGSRHRLWGC